MDGFIPIMRTAHKNILSDSASRTQTTRQTQLYAVPSQGYFQVSGVVGGDCRGLRGLGVGVVLVFCVTIWVLLTWCAQFFDYIKLHT